MPYTLTFDKDYGNRLQSSKDASVSNVPGASLVDLAGCGGQTHAYGQADISINALDNCAPKGLALQYAYSGYAGFISGSPMTLHGLNGESSGSLSLNTSVLDLANYAVLVASGITQWNAPTIWADLQLGTAVTQTQFGRNLLFTDASTGNRQVAQLSRPAVSDIVDNCGLIIGKRTKTSMSIFGYDPDTCRPSLLWQASINIGYGRYLYPIGSEVNAVSDIFNDLSYSEIFGVALNANIQESAETTWKNEQFNQPIEMG